MVYVQNFLYINYSKGNKYIMRNLLNIVEDKNLKREIIDVVKATDDLSVLQKVLNTLRAGNIEERIQSVIGKDGDAQRFIKQIVTAILQIDAPVDEKNAFLERYAKGTVIDTKKLLDKRVHTFSELVGTGFSLELFNHLSVELVSQGVGPSEVALAVLSPDIQWSGRSQGGGDIQVKNKPIEVKTRVSKGGRWINARKAKLDLGAIVTAITQNSVTKVELPDRINPSYWVETLRPNINPKKLKAVAKTIADSTFKFVDNKAYQEALIAGDASAIVNAFLAIGYNNYKQYSGFVGMLLMDMPTSQAQYFVEYSEMSGNISVSTTYILAPESEMMPQVILAPGSGPIRAGKFKSDTTAIATATQKGKTADVKKKVDEYAKKICDHYGITNLTTLGHIKGTILADLANGIDPAKIPARLAKVFPELATRKKATPAPQPQAQPATPAEPIRPQRAQPAQPIRERRK